MINDPVENPNSSDEVPVAIFGGDFDCTSEQWLLCLKKEEATQAAQEDSGWKSQSDHDVVLAPLCWRLHTPAETARSVVAT